MRLKTFTTVGHQQGHGASGQISFTTGESKEREGGGGHAPALGPISFICLQVLQQLCQMALWCPSSGIAPLCLGKPGSTTSFLCIKFSNRLIFLGRGSKSGFSHKLDGIAIMPILPSEVLLREIKSSDKMLPPVGIEPRPLIASDSKSNTILSIQWNIYSLVFLWNISRCSLGVISQAK